MTPPIRLREEALELLPNPSIKLRSDVIHFLQAGTKNRAHLASGRGVLTDSEWPVRCMESHSQGNVGIRELPPGSLTIVLPPGPALDLLSPRSKPLAALLLFCPCPPSHSVLIL